VYVCVERGLKVDAWVLGGREERERERRASKPVIQPAIWLAWDRSRKATRGKIEEGKKNRDLPGTYRAVVS